MPYESWGDDVMEIKKAGIIDYGKTGDIVVDNRELFDNPVFLEGAPPEYSGWMGLKPFLKYLSILAHPRKHIFFAMEGGKTAGAAVVEGSMITGLFVNKAFRGRGVGKSLIDHVCSFMRDRSKTVEVGAQVVNKEAIKFYEKNGFRLKEKIFSKKLR